MSSATTTTTPHARGVGRSEVSCTEVQDFNKAVAARKLGGPIDEVRDVPHITLRYPGYPNAQTRALRLLSVRPANERPDDQEVVPCGAQTADAPLGDEQLRYECEIAMGSAASASDLAAYRRALEGKNHLVGTDPQADIFNYDTWYNHCYQSMMERGNCNESDGSLFLLLDAEYGVEVRLAEREWHFNRPERVVPVSIAPPQYSTYTNFHHNAHTREGNGNDGGCAGGASSHTLYSELDAAATRRKRKQSQLQPTSPAEPRRPPPGADGAV